MEVEGSYVLRILHLVKEKHLSGKDLQKSSSTEASAVTFCPLTLTIVQSKVPMSDLPTFCTVNVFSEESITLLLPALLHISFGNG